jgi:hypothetical protein
LVETPLYLLHIADEVQSKFRDHLGVSAGEMGMQLEEEEDAAETCCVVKMEKKKK